MINSISIQEWDAKPIKFAWPGGYPVYYVAREGYRNDETGELEFNKHDKEEFICCAGCIHKREVIVITQDVNYEDPSMYCEVCSQRIESAYAEKD